MLIKKHKKKSPDEYSLSDLAKIYGVGRGVIKKWIEHFTERVGEKQGRYYTLEQVKIIFECLGVPDEFKSE